VRIDESTPENVRIELVDTTLKNVGHLEFQIDAHGLPKQPGEPHAPAVASHVSAEN
jgi:hypothetical protein